MQVITHSYAWHDAYTCVTWLIHICDMTHSYVWHDGFTCVTWLIHMCDITHSYVWHDALIRVTWRIHICDMTHSYVYHDAVTCVTWLIHTCDTYSGSVLAGFFFNPYSVILTENVTTDVTSLWQLQQFTECHKSRTKKFSRVTIDNFWQIPGLSVRVPRGTYFRGPTLYPWEISADNLKICEVRTSERGIKSGTTDNGKFQLGLRHVTLILSLMCMIWLF